MSTSRTTAALPIAIAAIFGGGCTFDFAEPFSGPSPSGTGTGGAGAGGLGGAAALVENCTNGQDDDADGLADCEDEGCDTFTCVEPAPDGWKGPVVVRRHATEPPVCDEAHGSTLAAGVGLTVGDHTCSACGCDPAEGGSCGASVTVWDQMGCFGATEATLDVEGVCTMFATSDTTSYAEASPPTLVTPSSCPPIGGAVAKDRAVFDEHVALCGDEAHVGTCAGGEACIAAPTGKAELCIYADGDTPCPMEGVYVERSIVHQGIDDDRGCAPCTCGAPIGAACSTTTNIYSSAACAGAVEQLSHDGSCNGFNSPTTLWYLMTTTGPGGSCIALGGAPTGAASLTDPLTVCCARTAG